MENRNAASSPVSSLEQKVRECTKELVIYLDELRSLSNIPTKEKAQDFQKKMNELVEEIVELRAKAIHSPHVKSNPHVNFFLLLVSKYNLLFLRVGATLEEAKAKKTPLLDKLKNLEINPINNRILGNSVNTILVYKQSVTKPEIFRNAYRREEDQRYFYDEAQAAPNYKNGKSFEEYYGSANLAIGAGTQITNFFALVRPKATTQSADSFYRHRDKEPAKIEKRHFRSGMDKLTRGEELSEGELKVFSNGEYHRSNGSSVVHDDMYIPGSKQHAIHFHRGHASQEIDKGVLVVSIDPVNYHSGNKVLYKRHNEAGGLAKYIFAQVVWYSHNHYDHLDQRTALEAWQGIDALFIVPIGCGELLREWGFENVVEMKTWNDFVEVTAYTHEEREVGKLTVYAFPAKHASNRVLSPAMPDINLSLYMGCMLHCKDENHLTLVTGDTAVLDDRHLKELQAFLIKRKLIISSACIAAGPDRPRSLMECTHQSSADALVLHARLNIMNRNVAKVAGSTAVACHGIAYHQGCFRLGKLNYNDVESTFTRIFTALAFYKEKPLAVALDNLKEQKKGIGFIADGVGNSREADQIDNLPFMMMDEFERKALIEMLEVYCSHAAYKDLSASEFIKKMSYMLHLPKAGEMLDLSNPQLKGFEYQYHRLIVNCNKLYQVHGDKEEQKVRHAYEDILHQVKPEIVEELAKNDRSVLAITELMLSVYVARKLVLLMGKDQHVNQFLKQLKEINAESLYNQLALLVGRVNDWKTFDETQRDEGHFGTIMVVTYGLLSDANFREKFIADYKKAHPEMYPAISSASAPPPRPSSSVPSIAPRR